MSEAFYSHARLYDLMFPGRAPAVDFYRGTADRQGGSVLELGCGTGHLLIPIASDGHPCVGLDLSPDMLAEARRKAQDRGVEVEWVQGDMRSFDLGRTFDLVVIAANSLLHLHEAEDLVSCIFTLTEDLDAEFPAVAARLISEAGIGTGRTSSRISATSCLSRISSASTPEAAFSRAAAPATCAPSTGPATST